MSAPENLQNLIVDRDGAVATITINRPKVLNALNTPTMDELRKTVLALRHDESVRAVIITGAGEKSFVAGADINELSVQTPAGGIDTVISSFNYALTSGVENLTLAATAGNISGTGNELDNVLTVTATYESWDFRWAYVVRYAEDYRLTVDQRRTLLERSLAESHERHEFYVALYAQRYKWNDLNLEEPAWILRLIDDTGNPQPPVVSRFGFETPTQEERLGTGARFSAPPSGGMFLARSSTAESAVLLPPLIRDFTDLKCSPQVTDEIRSADSAIRLLRLATLWGRARETGLFSSTRRRDVMQVLAQSTQGVLAHSSVQELEVITGFLAQTAAVLQDVTVRLRAVPSR